MNERHCLGCTRPEYHHICGGLNQSPADRHFNATVEALRKIVALRTQHNLSPSVRLARAILDAEGAIEAIDKEIKENDR